MEEVHARILEELGSCDILVNGAGGNNPRATTDDEYHHEAAEGQRTFVDLDADGVDIVFRLNFQGTLLPTQVFAKDMVEKGAGSILNISSMNSYIPLTKELSRNNFSDLLREMPYMQAFPEAGVQSYF